MKFGSVKNPENIDFILPADHPDTASVLKNSSSGTPRIFVGCAKWNRKELKNFYPAGTSDELEYYATQFNAIELNATFYRNFSSDQVSDWRKKVPDHFRFFPKVNQQISHRKWMKNVEEPVEFFLNSIIHFKEKLGTTFLQLRDNFAPKYFQRVADFIELWPDDLPLAIEFRDPEWFNDSGVAEELYQLLEENRVANVIVDTAAHRNLLHMRLTSGEAFIRYVGANHPTDYSRLDDWVERLKQWSDQGLKKIDFMVHQNKEVESPKLAAHFIENLNDTLNTDLHIPLTSDDQKQLF